MVYPYNKKHPRTFNGKRYYSQGIYWTHGADPKETLAWWRNKGFLARLVWEKPIKWPQELKSFEDNRRYKIFVRPREK
jgi:hypothetical protein